MTTTALPRLGADLDALVKRAVANYDAMTPSQKLRHRYMQRRSFARGMCPSSADYAKHCALVDQKMPHEVALSDAQIGLVLLGEMVR